MAPLQIQVAIGAIATFIGLVGYVPYFRELAKRSIKPHAFSWLVWGALQSLVFSAQITNGGGAGAWAVGAPALLCLAIFAIALFRGEKEITRLDWMFLLGAVAAIAMWAITKVPLYSVMLAVTIDVFAFAPTFRKSYKRPNEESVSVFSFSALSFFMSLFALQSVNLTTALYPAYLAAANAAFVMMVLLRRRAKQRR